MNPKQARAAALIGRGYSMKAAAAEVGVSSRTLSRWRQRPDFELAVERAREAQLSDRPTVQGTLEAALSATKRDGEPDWNVRVAAARALLGASNGRSGDGGSPPLREPAGVPVRIEEQDGKVTVHAPGIEPFDLPEDEDGE